MSETNIQKNAKAPVEATRESQGRRVTPAVDIFESGEGFLILADLPGVVPGATRVEFNPPELLVGGKTDALGGPVEYERRFELGSGVDPASISAELKHGVLKIELKKSAHLRPRRVEVRSAGQN